MKTFKAMKATETVVFSALICFLLLLSAPYKPHSFYKRWGFAFDFYRITEILRDNL
ncbi:hypothetical protein SAMN05660472_00466 [Natronincola ferrireducens]|uniref:Uncharacterized protein n=1 Tax=Natronincola ferrireducens TaxID=393762 RepID=A0A1G8Y8Z4_9FIRM|nr:hypothetical protein SAMN05660472_00466 [Natronincola ferrireducens]